MKFKFYFNILFSLLFLYKINIIHSKVIGFDLGGEFFKIALVKPGTPFEIVTNIHSKRKTETVVAFDGEERLYGADAMNIGLRRPNSAYFYIRRLLGSSIKNPSVTALTESEYFPYTIISNDTRGSLHIAHQNNLDQLFHAEELLAMVFSHAKDITKTFGGTNVNDWVITVPVFFTQFQRQAVLDAAHLANIRVLGLINENTAAALQLGIDRIDEEPKKILFYNFGSSSIQVSVVEYSSAVVPDGFKKNKTIGTFSVMGHSYDEHLGGAKFDLRLAEYLADKVNEQFKLKPNKDIRSIARPMAKIRAQAKKTKIVLSANENIPVVMQSLYDDRDFSTVVTRKEFEEMSDDLFKKVLDPVKKLLDDLNMKPNELDGIEIVGGAVRMPKVQTMLKEYFNQDLGVHLNGDEAMALGAAFRAANVSTAFRVRKIGMHDIQSFDIGLRLSDSTEWSKKASLFKKKSKLGARKVVSFTHDTDFNCTFRYQELESLPDGVSSLISHYHITGLNEFNDEMKEKNLGVPKVSISFHLSASGIVSIVSVEASLEEILPIENTEEKDEKHDEENKDGKNKDEKNKDEEKKEGETPDEEKPNLHEESTDSAKSGNEVPNETNSTSSNSTIEIVKPKPKKKIHSRKLKVELSSDRHSDDLTILPMSLLDKEESLDLLKDMQKRDDERKLRAQAKNELESYVYASRDKLSSSKEDLLVSKVVTEENVEKLMSEINDTEDWLYDDGENAETPEYKKRMNSMKKDLDGMIHRMNELTARPAAVNRVNSYDSTVNELLEEWPTSKPHITEDDRKKVLERMEDLKKWVDEKVIEQNKLQLTDDPIFTSAEVLHKLKDVKRYVKKISNKKPPPPPPAPKNETNAETNSTSEDSKSEDSINFEGQQKSDDSTNSEDLKSDDKDKTSATEDVKSTENKSEEKEEL